jgi:Uma2 family endonuclease
VKTLLKWTVEDYHQMIEAGILADRRVELLEGEIVEMSPEDAIHYAIGDSGTDYLKELLGQRAYVRLDGPITLGESEPEPDIAIVRPPRSLYFNHHPGPADIFWLIEVANTSLDKDLSDKQRIYASAGIPEYWIINLQVPQLIVFREPRGTDYQTRMTFTDGIVYPLAFPDVAVSVERLLRGE